MPKSDSNASCQNGAPTLNNMTMTAQPTIVVRLSFRLSHHSSPLCACQLETSLPSFNSFVSLNPPQP